MDLVRILSEPRTPSKSILLSSSINENIKSYNSLVGKKKGINESDIPHKRIDEMLEQKKWREICTIIEKRVIESPKDVEKYSEICGKILHAVCHISDLNLSALNLILATFPEAAKEKEIRYSRLPIHTACINNLPLGLVYALIYSYRKGLQVADQNGNLPLHVACSCSSIEVVQALIEVFPQAVTVPNKKQELPLHISCSRWDASKEVVHYLLSKFPEACHHKDIQGFLPIHSACMWQVPVDVVKLLIEAGPRSIISRDNDGDTPFDILKNNEISIDDPTMICIKNAMSKIGGIMERVASQIKLVRFEIENSRREQSTKRILRESSLKHINY